MLDTNVAPPPRAGRREWLGLLALALPTLMIALDIGALFLALPHLSTDLKASGTQQLWITDIYGFMIAGFLITMGTLGDRIGRRRLLLIGAAGFGVASVIAAFSTSPEMLILARALLGIAGATLGPSTLALISNMFRDPKQMGVAISLWAFCQFGGAALGPVIGGVMLEHFWWGSVFLLGVPVMVLLMIVGPILLPEYRDQGAGRLDLFSVVLSLGAILPIVYGVKQLAAGDNASKLVPVGAIVVGLLVGLVFVRRQLRLPSPLLDLRLFRASAFSTALSAMLLASATLAGVSLMTSQYVQSVLGLNPAEAGLWQAPTGLGIAIGVLSTPSIVKKLAPSTVITGGLVVTLAGLLILTQVSSTGGPVIVSLGVGMAALGVGPLFVLGTGLVVGSAPPEKAGSAASMSETSNVFGSTAGLALLGSVGAFVFRHQIADATDNAVARETIAGAVFTAKGLPAEQSKALLSAANDAFTSGLNIVAVISAVIIVGLIVLTTVVLRQKTPPAVPAGADGGTGDDDKVTAAS
ncbi:MFS transporter [Longispora sp. K20-0274]|uniref:MFS transporter n=1 Tax=Longispora sp. K20-0274 TaxID=3088255 RepID=UPI00399A931A